MPPVLPVQHTEDAPSRETRNLHRCCFNCNTTKAPSWRRSQLNPGKILCNKCGLYERSPFGHRLLRAEGKVRKVYPRHRTHTPGQGDYPPSAGMPNASFQDIQMGYGQGGNDSIDNSTRNDFRSSESSSSNSNPNSSDPTLRSYFIHPSPLSSPQLSCTDPPHPTCPSPQPSSSPHKILPPYPHTEDQQQVSQMPNHPCQSET